jgi:hypothetical protein
MFSLRIVAFWIGAAFIALSEISIAEEDWRSRFEREYPAAADKLISFYHNLSITEYELGQFTDETRDFRAVSDSIAISVTPTKPKEGPPRVYVYRPDVFFRGHRSAVDQRTIVLDGLQRPPSPEDLETIRIHAKLPYASFSCLGLTVAELMRQPSFAIEQVVEKTDGDETRVEVYWKCEFAAVKGGVLKRKGIFAFDPFRGWVLCGYTVGVEQSTAGMACSIDYDGVRQDIPLIREAKYWTHSEDERSQESVVKIVHFDFEAQPKDVFSLEYYGISDAVLSTTPRNGRPVATFFLVGNVFAAIAIVLYLIARRKQSVEE